MMHWFPEEQIQETGNLSTTHMHHCLSNQFESLTLKISEILTGVIMGKAVQIVKIDDESETHKFFLDEEALNEILNKDNIRDKPICIISVAGNT